MGTERGKAGSVPARRGGQERTKSGKPGDPSAKDAPSGAGDLLDLQRQAGNKAVVALVAPHGPAGPATRSGGTTGEIALQRARVLRIQRKGRRPPSTHKAADDEQVQQVLAAGVGALETLAGYRGAPEGPVLVENAPAEFRPALERLKKAKQYRFGAGMPSATDAVRERLAAEGPAGIAKLFFLHDQMVAQEQLSRALAAKTEWQVARPSLARLAAVTGASDGHADTVKRLLLELDEEMTSQVAARHLELLKYMTPDEAKRARAVAEAKEALGVLDQIVEKTQPFFTAAGVLGKAEEAVTDRHVRLGKDLDNQRPMPAGVDSDTELSPDQEGALFDVDESGTSATFTKGLAAVKSAKSLIGVYESGKNAGAALETITKEGSSGVEMAKASADLASAILTPVSEAGSLLIKGSAEVLEKYQWRLMTRHLEGKGGNLARAASIGNSVKGLRSWADKLGGLEKVTGVLGVISGALAVIDGVEKNDAEATISSALDVAEGVLGLTASGATATVGSIGILQVKAMLQVVGDMSRSLQAIRNVEMRGAVKTVADSLTSAGLHARLYNEAIEQYFLRANSPDPVESRLAQTFLGKAREEVAGTQQGIVAAFSSAINGKLSRFPVLRDTFCAPFGGPESTMGLALLLGGEIPEGFSSNAQLLQDDILPKLSQAVGDLSLTVDAAVRGSSKLKFSEEAHNTLSVRTRAIFGDYGAVDLGYQAGDFELDGPIDDEKYRAWLAQRLRRKSLGQIQGFVLRLETAVLTDRVTLSGSSSGLLQSQGLTEFSVRHLAPLARREGVTDDTPTASDVAAALWRLHLRKVRVPTAAFAG